MVKKKSMKMPRPGVCLETRDYKEPESSTLGWSSLPCSPNPGYGGVMTNQVNASNTEDKTLQGQLGGVNMEATDIVNVTTDKTEASKRDVTHEIIGDAVTPSQGLEGTTSTCSTLVGSSPNLGDLDPAQTDLDPNLANLNQSLADLGPDKTNLGPSFIDLDPSFVDLNPSLNNFDPNLSYLGLNLSDLGPNQVDLGPNQADLSCNQVDLSLKQADTDPNHANLDLKQADLGPNQADLSSNQADLVSNLVDIGPNLFDFSPNQNELSSNITYIKLSSNCDPPSDSKTLCMDANDLDNLSSPSLGHLLDPSNSTLADTESSATIVDGVIQESSEDSYQSNLHTSVDLDDASDDTSDNTSSETITKVNTAPFTIHTSPDQQPRSQEWKKFNLFSCIVSVLAQPSTLLCALPKSLQAHISTGVVWIQERIFSVDSWTRLYTRYMICLSSKERYEISSPEIFFRNFLQEYERLGLVTGLGWDRWLLCQQVFQIFRSNIELSLARVSQLVLDGLVQHTDYFQVDIERRMLLDFYEETSWKAECAQIVKSGLDKDSDQDVALAVKGSEVGSEEIERFGAKHLFFKYYEREFGSDGEIKSTFDKVKVEFALEHCPPSQDYSLSNIDDLILDEEVEDDNWRYWVREGRKIIQQDSEIVDYLLNLRKPASAAKILYRSSSFYASEESSEIVAENSKTKNLNEDDIPWHLLLEPWDDEKTPEVVKVPWNAKLLHVPAHVKIVRVDSNMQPINIKESVSTNISNKNNSKEITSEMSKESRKNKELSGEVATVPVKITHPDENAEIKNLRTKRQKIKYRPDSPDLANPTSQNALDRNRLIPKNAPIASGPNIKLSALERNNLANNKNTGFNARNASVANSPARLTPGSAKQVSTPNRLTPGRNTMVVGGGSNQGSVPRVINRSSPGQSPGLKRPIPGSKGLTSSQNRLASGQNRIVSGPQRLTPGSNGLTPTLKGEPPGPKGFPTSGVKPRLGPLGMTPDSKKLPPGPGTLTPGIKKVPPGPFKVTPSGTRKPGNDKQVPVSNSSLPNINSLAAAGLNISVTSSPAQSSDSKHFIIEGPDPIRSGGLDNGLPSSITINKEVPASKSSKKPPVLNLPPSISCKRMGPPNMPDNLTNLPLSMSVKMVQPQKEVELIELDKPNSTQFANLPPGVVIERMGNIKQVTKDSATKTPDITRSATSKTAKGPGRPRSNNKSAKKPGESIQNGKKPSNGNVGLQGNSIQSSNAIRPPPSGINHKMNSPSTNVNKNMPQSIGKVNRQALPRRNTKKPTVSNVKKPIAPSTGASKTNISNNSSTISITPVSSSTSVTTPGLSITRVGVSTPPPEFPPPIEITPLNTDVSPAIKIETTPDPDTPSDFQGDLLRFIDSSLRVDVEETKGGGKKRVYKCNICEFGHSSRWEMENHIEANHSTFISTYKCDLCDFTATNRAAYYEHGKKQHGFKIPKQE